MTPIDHAVVVGAGGLGCPVLLGLLAAGTPRITVVDGDTVEASNLPRQVLYGPADAGFGKAETARLALLRRAPDLEVEAVPARVVPDDAGAFVSGLPDGAVVFDATDDPDLKFALNDACRRLGRRLVIGAGLGLCAQVMGVGPEGACYRCIYEAPPPPDLRPTCAEAGVLPTAVGLAGFLMVQVALCGDYGTLHVFDAATTTFRALTPAPRPGCPACGATGGRRTPAPLRRPPPKVPNERSL